MQKTGRFGPPTQFGPSYINGLADVEWSYDIGWVAQISLVVLYILDWVISPNQFRPTSDNVFVSESSRFSLFSVFKPYTF